MSTKQLTQEVDMSRARITVGMAAALALAASAPAASADATLRQPSSQASCIAQAWVPANTDPDTAAGVIGSFMRTGIAAGGALAQRGDKDCGQS